MNDKEWHEAYKRWRFLQTFRGYQDIFGYSPEDALNAIEWDEAYMEKHKNDPIELPHHINCRCILPGDIE